MNEQELLTRISTLESQLEGMTRQLQRANQDLRKKDEDREKAKAFLEIVRDKTQPQTKEYEDVDRLIQVLRAR